MRSLVYRRKRKILGRFTMHPAPLEHKVALITGGASGIGEATVRLLASEGATVVALDRDQAGLDRVAREVHGEGGKVLSERLDLMETDSIEGVVARVVESQGRIDILVNCAGVFGDEGSILDLSEATWDLVHTIDLKAPFLLMQHVGRHMVARGGGGRIVNVSSSSAFRARQSIATYGAAKAGLVQLTRSAAADLGAYDINVNAVAPGLTATPMTADYGNAEELDKETIEGPLSNLLHRVSRPEDVAEAILFLCLPASRQITGQTIHTSAGAITV
jgi:NAD(P)-dependent dehydrogenase (short-subunit alcohol dehydrogenase family)